MCYILHTVICDSREHLSLHCRDSLAPYYIVCSIPSSGQFFSKGTRIDQGKRRLLLPSRSPIPVVLEDPKPEVHHKSQCWRLQTPGYQGEGLIEGDYTEYVVDSVFASDFKYSLTLLEQS